MITTHCPHTVSQGREGEPSGKSWCVDCGAVALDIDPRQCGDCQHIAKVIGGHICRKHLMAVVPSMNVCFKPSEGSCFVAAHLAAQIKQGE